MSEEQFFNKHNHLTIVRHAYYKAIEALNRIDMKALHRQTHMVRKNLLNAEKAIGINRRQLLNDTEINRLVDHINVISDKHYKEWFSEYLNHNQAFEKEYKFCEEQYAVQSKPVENKPEVFRSRFKLDNIVEYCGFLFSKKQREEILGDLYETKELMEERGCSPTYIVLTVLRQLFFLAWSTLEIKLRDFVDPSKESNK